MNERVTRELVLVGSYIKEWNKSLHAYGNDCYGLASTGRTMTASNNEEMLNLIRKEYKAMRRSERR